MGHDFIWYYIFINGLGIFAIKKKKLWPSRVLWKNESNMLPSIGSLNQCMTTHNGKWFEYDYCVSYPLGLRWLARVGCILGHLCNWFSQFVPKKKRLLCIIMTFASSVDYNLCTLVKHLKNIHLSATSRTRLRARDHYTSSTLIGGKSGAGPSSLHTTLGGPTEYVIARWM